MTYSFLRPKTSSGLSSIHNDSTIYSPTATTTITTSSTSTSANPSFHLSARRSTQEFLSRPSFSSSAETRIVTKSTGNLAQAFSRRHRDPEHKKDRESEGRLRKGVDDVKFAAAAMVRKALQGSREMRPIERLAPLTTNVSTDPYSSSSPATNTRSRDRPPSRQSSTSLRKHYFHRHRRGAVSLRSGKHQAISPSDREITHVGEVSLGMAMAMIPALSPTISLTIPGSAARASAAEHNKSQQLTRSDTKMSRSRSSKMPLDEMMVDEVTGHCEKSQHSRHYGEKMNTVI
jgi:hypothetical protein